LEEPIRIRSGDSRSRTAVPSARNSGFDNTSKGSLGRYSVSYYWSDLSSARINKLTMPRTVCAVPHGTVDFSTTNVPGLAFFATVMTALSKAARLVADPAPIPLDFEGVLTATNTTSASEMQRSTSVENIKFGCRTNWVVVGQELSEIVSERNPSRAIRTMRSKPGSWTGRCFECHFRMRPGSLSTTETLI